MGEDAEPRPQEQQIPETLRSDALLLEDLRAGQEDAFVELFRRYYRRVYGMLYRLVGEEADDLAQEVFLQLYRRPPGTAEAGLSAWLYRVATRLGYNALRATRRRQSYQRAWEGDASQAGTHSVPAELEDLAERSEAQHLVRQALARLSRREAQLLILRYSDLSYREIALALGLAEGSVGTLLARAERRFAKVYGQLTGPERREGGG